MPGEQRSQLALHSVKSGARKPRNDIHFRVGVLPSFRLPPFHNAMESSPNSFIAHFGRTKSIVSADFTSALLARLAPTRSPRLRRLTQSLLGAQTQQWAQMPALCPSCAHAFWASPALTQSLCAQPADAFAPGNKNGHKDGAVHTGRASATLRHSLRSLAIGDAALHSAGVAAVSGRKVADLIPNWPSPPNRSTCHLVSLVAMRNRGSEAQKPELRFIRQVAGRDEIGEALP